MQKIKYRISLDMLEVASQTTVKAKKGDTACSIVMTLTENGKIYHIADGCRAVFSGKKFDGNYLFNGETCRIEDNTIIYDFTEQTVPIEGVVECEAILYKDNEQLTTPRFNILVGATVYNGEEIVSTPETDALKELIEESENRVNGLIEEGESLFEEIDIAHKNNSQVFSNALKGTASGAEVCMTDVSPLQHNINVTLSGGTNDIDDYTDIKLYRSGKNLLPYPYNGSNNGQHVNYTFTDNGDGSITVKGQHINSAGHANFYLLRDSKLVLPKGSYTASGLVAGIYLQGKRTADGITVDFTKGLTLTETTEFNTLFVQIPKTNTTAYDTVIKPMLELGKTATDYVPPIGQAECIPDEDGKVTVPSAYPLTWLFTDAESVTITAEYNKDINKVLNDTEILSILQKDIMRELAYLNDEGLQKDFNDSIQNGIGYSGSAGSVIQSVDRVARAITPPRSYNKDVFLIPKLGYQLVIFYLDENDVVTEKSIYASNGIIIPKNQIFATMIYNNNNPAAVMTNEEVKSVITVQNEEVKEEKRKLCGAFLDGKYINIAYSQINNPISTVINTAEHYNLAGQTDGFDAIKGDIQITSDNELVMCHDNGFTFDDNGRITTFNKDDCTLIRNMTYADVIALEHARQFEGVYVHPTGIDSILRACKRYGKIPFITIRDENIDVIAPILIDKLRKYSLETCSIINSFTLASLATIRQYSDIVFLSQVLNQDQNLSQIIIDRINEFGNVVISVFDSDASTVETTNAEMIEHAKSRGIRILGAIFNNSDTIEYVLNNGFSGGQAYIPF